MTKTKWDDIKSVKSLICFTSSFLLQIKYDEIVIFLVHCREMDPYWGMATHSVPAS